VYRPALVGSARVHFVDAKADIDQWQTITVAAPLGNDIAGDVWETAAHSRGYECGAQPETGASFAQAPAVLSRAKSYAAWHKALAAWLYRSQRLRLWNCAELKAMSPPGTSEADFRIQLQQRLRERRDAGVDKLRKRYASKIATLENQIRRAEERVAREKSQLGQQTLQTTISVGSSILGAILGRKLASRTNVTGAASAARSAGRAAREQQDVRRAEEELNVLRGKLADLEAEVQREVASLESAASVDRLLLEEYPVRPRKSDISVSKVFVAWLPWSTNADGRAEPAF
jgi:hypothetical protein